MEKLETRVRFIKNKYHIRLIENGFLINEMACESKMDISWCCNHLLRWYDKLGGVSKMASSSRARNKNKQNPIGKIWFEKDLRPKYIGTYVA